MDSADMHRTITQVVVLQLQRLYSNVELARDKHHVMALKKLEEIEGFQNMIWSVPMENASKLVWLVEWNTPPQATIPFMRDSEVIVDRYCTFEIDPSQMLSPERPVLEVFQYRLIKGSTLSDNAKAMQPVTDHWKAEDRPFGSSKALAKPLIDDKEDGLCMMLVPWKSQKEQMSELQQEYFKKALKAADPTREVVSVYNIKPIQCDTRESRCSQVVVLQLRHDYSNADLACNKAHVEALKKMEEMEGCEDVIWSVTKEDASKLVWLIEWSKVPKATTPLMQDSEVVLNRYCTFEVAPSGILSLDRPVLEVFQYRLINGSTVYDNAEAMKPVLDHWKAEGRPFVSSKALSKPLMDGKDETQCVMLVPWTSKQEHLTALEQKYFIKALKAAEHTREIVFFSHIEPIFRTAQKSSIEIRLELHREAD